MTRASTGIAQVDAVFRVDLWIIGYTPVSGGAATAAATPSENSMCLFPMQQHYAVFAVNGPGM